VEGVFGSAEKQDILSACYLPRSGRALATGTRSGRIFIWCTKTCQLRKVVPAHNPRAMVPSFHTGQPISAGVSVLCLTHSLSQLVSGGADNAIMRWNIPEDSADQLSQGLVLVTIFTVQDPMDSSPIAFSGLDCSPLGTPEVIAGTHR
jgi:WD40 repeat protein